MIIKGCYLDCNDDGVCIKGGKGVYAHKSSENGIVENVLVEDCTFGPNLHGTLTMGSECIHAKNIVLRNCKVDNTCALLRLKMRPDTYQVYENIHVSNVTGRCGSVIDMKPWTQFFDLENSGEKPYGVVKNILIENVDVTCTLLGGIAGNSDDQVSDVVLKNVHVKAKKTDFICKYPQVKFEDVTMNGKVVTNPAK